MWKWSGVARGVGIRAEVWIPEATPEPGQNLMLLSLFFFGIDSYSKTVFDVPYVIFYTFFASSEKPIAPALERTYVLTL